MYITVFSDFTSVDTLSTYCSHIEIVPSFLRQNSTQQERHVAKNNIKIFFNTQDIQDREHAYSLMNILQLHNVATFITDQLYSTVKDSNGTTRTIPLPKDRIIMTLL